jgi:uncharacterized membrane protein
MADEPADPLPFVAPCRQLGAGAPLRWIALGWRDVRRAPGPTFTCGLVVVMLSWFVSLLAYRLGSYILLLAMLSGFVFVAPVIAIGLYEVARQLGRGDAPSVADAVRGTRRALGNAMVFALALLGVFLVWARAASVISVFLPMGTNATPLEFLAYFGVGTAVGSLFAAITFSASAFSLAMIDERDCDTVTALLTSINAVLRNKPAMVVWAALIVASLCVGFATAFLAFWLLIPLLGYATWHAYEEAIDAAAWPKTGDSSLNSPGGQ